MELQSVDIVTCTGSIADLGAQVLSWQPRGEAEVLYTGSIGEARPGAPVRGGVPICFPWFGPGRDPGAPHSHGFARSSSWTLIANEIADEAQQVTYRLSHPSASDDYWPHEYWALLTASFGKELTVSLAVTNLDDRTISYEAALHTYLAVDDIAAVRLDGLDGVSYVDKTDGGAVKTQVSDLTFAGEVDRVYATAGPVTVLDGVSGRATVVSTSGASHIVVWNPGRVRAADLVDLVPDGWKRFVCVEAGRVLDGAVVLEPGQTHTLSTTIRV